MIQLSNLGLVLSKPPCLSCYSYHTWVLSFLNCSTSLDTAIIWASLPVCTAVKPALHPFWTPPTSVCTAVKPGQCPFLASPPQYSCQTRALPFLGLPASVCTSVRPRLCPFWPPCLCVYICQTRALSFLGLPASVCTSVRPGLCPFWASLPLCVHLSDQGSVLSGPPCLSVYSCQTRALSFLGLPASVYTSVRPGHCPFWASLPQCVQLSNQGTVLSGPPCLSLYICHTWALSFLDLPASVDLAVTPGHCPFWTSLPQLTWLSHLGTVLSGPPCLS